MTTFPPRNILVPVDFSPSSAAALDYALALAGRFNARVHVVHVWEDPPYIGPALLIGAGQVGATMTEYGQEHAEKGMKAFLSKARPHDCRVTSQWSHGVPHEAILGAADGSGFDLIVMGTHGRCGISHFLLGSVAERVVRHAKCPVLTIRADEQVAKPAAPAAASAQR